MDLKTKLWFYLLGGQWPQEKGYTILEGVIRGPVRYESFDGSEFYINPASFDNLTYFKNSPPVERNGKVFSVSPIQKKSTWGWLKCSPDAYFYWNMSKLQDFTTYAYYGTPKEIWVEGTEKGIYFRGIPSWRIDFPGTVIDGELRHWIPSGGHIGPRYD